MDVAVVVSVLGALGVGSLLTQWFTRSIERRKYRADALTGLGTVEAARWHPHAADVPRLRGAVLALRTSSLLAGVPRGPVELYITLAAVGSSVSHERWENEHDEEVGGYIDSDLADTIAAAAELVTRCIWTPWRARLVSRHSSRKVRIQALNAERPSVRYQLELAMNTTV